MPNSSGFYFGSAKSPANFSSCIVLGREANCLLFTMTGYFLSVKRTF